MRECQQTHPIYQKQSQLFFKKRELVMRIIKILCILIKILKNGIAPCRLFANWHFSISTGNTWYRGNRSDYFSFVFIGNWSGQLYNRPQQDTLKRICYFLWKSRIILTYDIKYLYVYNCTFRSNGLSFIKK